MGFPAVAGTESVVSRIAPHSRVIPGRARTANGQRKPLQSLDRDGQIYSWVQPGDASPANSSTHRWLAYLLPSQCASGRRQKLVECILADILVASAGFAVGSLLAELLTGASLQSLSSLFYYRCAPTLVLLHASLVTLMAYAEGLYAEEPFPITRDQQLRLVKVVAVSTLLVATVLYPDLRVIMRMPLLCAGILDFCGMLLWRSWRSWRAARRTRRGEGVSNVLLVGGGQCAEEIANYFASNPCTNRVVRKRLGQKALGGRAHAPVSDLARIAREQFIDEVIIADPDRALVQQVIGEARRNRLDVKVATDLLGFVPQAGALHAFGNIPVITLYQEPLPTAGLFWKRITDIIGSAGLLILVAPFLLFVGLLIKLDSPGPVLYCAPRAGKKGRRFLCYKFRTMLADADTQKSKLRSLNQRHGPFFKMADDPRLTRAGRWLRRYSFDELPQLWNVLKGEMSLVGPRPHPLDDVARYRLGDLRRLDVVPGLTGLWQVTARSDPSFEHNMSLDLEYIECWNYWLDLRILCRTLPALLRGNGC